MIDLSLFRRFAATQALKPIDRAELARYSHLVRHEPGDTLFLRDSVATTAAFLVSGEVDLEGHDGRRRIIGGSDEARQALSNAARFSDTARCVKSAEVLYIDRDRLDHVLTWTQAGIIEVRELHEDDQQDWMAAMLRSPVLQRVPPSHIARVIASVEQVEFAGGESIIRAGAPGDCYYLLLSGNVRVLRALNPGATPVEVDRLGPGQGFGEEALVSGEPRNATVEAMGPCRLVRLSARDFTRFLKEPLVRSLKLDSAPAVAQLVDVRLPDEYAGGHLPGALNLPLRDLRECCSRLDSARPVLVYCDGGGRSASATFLLCERGFDAHWVEGGVPLSRMIAR